MPRVRNLRGSGIKPNAMPPGSVYIGGWVHGGWPPSKWRNPFRIDKPDKPRDGDRATVIAKHRAWICDQPDLVAALPELRGRDLWCWCAPDGCHGDALLRLAAEVPR